MADEELYDRCPYNKSHVILKSRMMYHVVKCKKSHQKIQYGATAPSNESMDSENSRRLDTSGKNLTTKEKELLRVPLPEPTENWDDTNVGFSYDPNLKVQSEPLLRCLAVAPKSERRDFRHSERKRFFIFDEKIPPETLRRQGTKPSQQNAPGNNFDKSSLGFVHNPKK